MLSFTVNTKRALHKDDISNINRYNISIHINDILRNTTINFLLSHLTYPWLINSKGKLRIIEINLMPVQTFDKDEIKGNFKTIHPRYLKFKA